MTLLEMATRVQELANGPEILDAVDTYYADDVVIVEATGDTFTGKQTQRDRVAEFMSSVATIHDSGVRGIAAQETAPGTGTVYAETFSDMDFHGGGRMLLEEVAAQRWEDGKIVHERFYYVPPPSE